MPSLLAQYFYKQAKETVTKDAVRDSIKRLAYNSDAPTDDALVKNFLQQDPTWQRDLELQLADKFNLQPSKTYARPFANAKSLDDIVAAANILQEKGAPQATTPSLTELINLINSNRSELDPAVEGTDNFSNPINHNSWSDEQKQAISSLLDQHTVTPQEKELQQKFLTSLFNETPVEDKANSIRGAVKRYLGNAPEDNYQMQFASNSPFYSAATPEQLLKAIQLEKTAANKVALDAILNAINSEADGAAVTEDTDLSQPVQIDTEYAPSDKDLLESSIDKYNMSPETRTLWDALLSKIYAHGPHKSLLADSRNALGYQFIKDYDPDQAADIFGNATTAAQLQDAINKLPQEKLI